MSEENRYHGKYKGYVRDNADPEGRGRLRVHCPQVMGDNDNPGGWLGWAEPCFPWMGGLSTLDMGVPYTRKQAGEEVGVWIEFERGLVDFPIWVGTFVVAPVRDGIHDRLEVKDQQTTSGGSLLASPPDGSTVADINPVKAQLPPRKEVRLFAKEGVDIVIGSKNGGSIVVGPNGADLGGVFVRINGKIIEASLNEVVGLWRARSVSSRAWRPPQTSRW